MKFQKKKDSRVEREIGYSRRMESLQSVCTSVILPSCSTHRSIPFRRRKISLSRSRSVKRNDDWLLVPRYFSSLAFPFSENPRFMSRRWIVNCKSIGQKGGEECDDADEDNGRDELDRALDLDGAIPGTSDEFVRRVSSRAYDMRRHLQQTFDTSSYDVLDSNPWREDSKMVYVLIRGENQLCTMKTRWNSSEEVEKELGLLFSKRIKKQAQQSRNDANFQMLVENIREGVLVFEDVKEAATYCDLLQGKGQNCQGVAEIEASSVFDLCRKSHSLAVIFRRGTTPPLPQTLERNLRSRKHSLED